MEGNLIDLDDHRDDLKYVVLAMCVPCSNRWIGGVDVKTSLFKLTCPECGANESFASFMPEEYQEALKTWAAEQAGQE